MDSPARIGQARRHQKRSISKMENRDMSTSPLPGFECGISTELISKMQEAANRAAMSIRDPERTKRARESMDRIREEIRREHGVLDIGVPAIRGLRDE